MGKADSVKADNSAQLLTSYLLKNQRNIVLGRSKFNYFYSSFSGKLLTYLLTINAINSLSWEC